MVARDERAARLDLLLCRCQRGERRPAQPLLRAELEAVFAEIVYRSQIVLVP